jgi:tetratricopeptide (TPR) repeat protein
MGEESATNGFRFASEMERIFESEEFARSPVMRRLLRFLVNQTLAGNGEHLKAYSVAVDGLGRDPDFDSQTDSYPRVQVGRLRRMLDAYYARAGFTYGYRLLIPTGAYRVHLLDVPAWPEGGQKPTEKPATQAQEGPSLEPAEQTDAAAPPVRHTLPGAGWLTGAALILGVIVIAMAVALAFIIASTERLSPLGNQSGSQVAYTRAPGMVLLTTEQGVNSPDGLAPSIDQVLGNAVHRSWVVDVRSSDGAASGARARPDTSRIAYRLQSVLAGPAGQDLYLTLWSNHTGKRIWTERIGLTGRQGALEDAIRLPVANLVGSLGIIAAQERQRFGPTIGPGYACLLNNAELRVSLDLADIKASHKCLEQTLALDRNSPTVLAASAAMHYRLSTLEDGQSEAAKTLRARARADAEAAIRLDPFSPDAQMASARIAFTEGRCSLGRAQALRAIDLNPYEPEYYAHTGMHLFACGYPDEEHYLTLARQMNPQLSAFYSMPVIVAMGERGQGEEALALAQSLPITSPTQMPFYAITMAVAYANGGQKTRAAGIWRQLAAAPENAGRTPRQILSAMLNSPALSRAIGLALVRAGIVDRLD